MKTILLFLAAKTLLVPILFGQNEATETDDPFRRAYEAEKIVVDAYFASTKGINDPVVRMLTYASKLIEINRKLDEPKYEISMSPNLVDLKGKPIFSMSDEPPDDPELRKHLLDQIEKHREIVKELNTLIRLRNSIRSKMAREASDMDPEIENAFDRLRTAIERRG